MVKRLGLVVRVSFGGFGGARPPICFYIDISRCVFKLNRWKQVGGRRITTEGASCIIPPGMGFVAQKAQRLTLASFPHIM